MKGLTAIATTLLALAERKREGASLVHCAQIHLILKMPLHFCFLLAGRLESMRNPFLDESRVMVVLYREPWGATRGRELKIPQSRKLALSTDEQAHKGELFR